jgi:hypothetical protein
VPESEEEALALPTLLSQALVAFTIEFDNEFEHRMPHRTTRHGATGPRGAPWLVSMAMWSNCLQYVPDEGICLRDLARRARITDHSMRLIVSRMGQWWGYLRADQNPPRMASLVRPTAAGRQAREVWQPLTGIVERRWRERHGEGPIDDLTASLSAVAGRLDVALPDFLPAGDPRLEPAPDPPPDPPPDADGRPLPTLLSQVLLAFALDFDRESVLPLAVCANVLRVLDAAGVPAADVPRRAGVAAEWARGELGRLAKRGFVIVEPGPARAKAARLTPKGQRAQDKYRALLPAIEHRWGDQSGQESPRTTKKALELIVTRPAGLARGLEPYPDGWRASAGTPQPLPHYPLILHRGGFPDGS